MLMSLSTTKQMENETFLMEFEWKTFGLHIYINLKVLENLCSVIYNTIYELIFFYLYRNVYL